MSSQIDPVTGLPVFAPPPLEEPPFLNPPFPWKDLTGIDVPPRTTYYGSDGIPTISTVAGMNPQDNRGQVCNTNGNHALMVALDTSGGGIGGAQNVVPYKDDLTTVGFGHDTIMTLGPIGSTIYGLVWSWAYDHGGSSPGNVNATLDLYISGGTSDDLFLGTMAIISIPAISYFALAGNQVISFGEGLKFPTANNYGDGLYHVEMESTGIGGGHMAIGVWCSA